MVVESNYVEKYVEKLKKGRKNDTLYRQSI